VAGTITATTFAAKGRGLVRANCAMTCVAGAIAAAGIGTFFGRLVAIGYDPVAGGGATMTTTADILLTDAWTGAPIISDLDMGTARWERPTVAIVDAAGAAVTPATTAPNCNRDIFVAGPLNLAVANATTTDTGLVSFVFDGGN